MNLYKRILSYIKPYLHVLFAALVCTMLAAAGNLYLPWIFRDMIDKVLAERLRHLTADRILNRCELPTPHYSLTEHGRDLYAVVYSMADWGMQHRRLMLVAPLTKRKGSIDSRRNAIHYRTVQHIVRRRRLDCTARLWERLTRCPDVNEPWPSALMILNNYYGIVYNDLRHETL